MLGMILWFFLVMGVVHLGPYCKVAFSATIFHIWQERNRRLFDNRRRSVEDLFNEIRNVLLSRMAWKCCHGRMHSVNMV